MATYYHPGSSNNPREAAAMHYIREPLPTSYSEVAVLPTNMMYMSYSSSSGSYSDALAVNNAQHQQHSNNCVEIPAAASDSTPQQQEILSNHAVEHDFSTWRDGRIRNEMLVTNHPNPNPLDLGGPASFLHAGVGQNLQAQGLSLSLGTQIPSAIQIPSIQYRNPNPNQGGFVSFLSPNSSVVLGEGASSRNGNSSRDENSRNAEFFPPGVLGAANQDSIKIDPSSYGMSGIARTSPHSKYLKAAQQLLDEVVNVRKALKQQPDFEKNQNIHELWKGPKEGIGTPPASSNSQEPVSNSSTDQLSPAERHELQNKMTKLLAMLDEVDRRYKQYYHQMQIVVSSFDAIAGSGAAKPYTALALQTISRHFRCLHDAITGQIRSTRRSLGEQGTSGNSKGVGICRLRYVDQQLRQQRALQQLGMMQQHAWRPQRGLPESSVSILRAWLFEHFLHPYPKDSDKIMLARQTGLTRSQVSNWFINARVRLWKPMVEEMYKEEIGDADIDSNSSSENAAPKVLVTKEEEDDDDDDDDDDGVLLRVSEEARGDDFQQSTSSTATERCSTGTGTGLFLDSKSKSKSIISARNAEMGGPRRAKTNFGVAIGSGAAHGDTQTEYGIVKLTGAEQRPTMEMEECSSLFPDGIVQSDGGGSSSSTTTSDRFMAAAAVAAYHHHLSDFGRFGTGTGGSVSLTLGLQHCEGGGSLPISIPIPGGGAHHSFVGMRGPSHMYNPAAAASSVETTDPAPTDFDCMDPATQQHRFNSSHLLHDFVA